MLGKADVAPRTYHNVQWHLLTAPSGRRLLSGMGPVPTDHAVYKVAEAKPNGQDSCITSTLRSGSGALTVS